MNPNPSKSNVNPDNGGARALRESNAVVVKVGSALIVDPDKDSLNRTWLDSLAQDIAALHERGARVVVVTSGAVAVGRAALKLPARKTLSLADAQAAAAAGQIDIARLWRIHLARHNVASALALLTLADTEERSRYLNARNALNALAKHNVVPIINENDAVAISDMRFGDNDRLAARIAAMIGADSLVLLSGVEGLLSPPPPHPDARLVPVVHSLSPEIHELARGAQSPISSGGMITKLHAAEIAVRAGCHMIIADGRLPHPLNAVLQGGKHTWFVASSSPARARKTWIAGSLRPNGAVMVDDGAQLALLNGASLLPAGVVLVSGNFKKGDAVSVLNKQKAEIARGLASYDARDAQKLLGRKSRAIAEILGYHGPNELIHRDDLAVLTSKPTHTSK